MQLSLHPVRQAPSQVSLHVPAHPEHVPLQLPEQVPEHPEHSPVRQLPKKLSSGLQRVSHHREI